MKRTSGAARVLIAGFEGCVLHAYRDTVGVLTIGYGHTGHGVHEGTISQARARELLHEDVRSFEDCVNRAVKVPLSQNQFDALVSFSFNVGCGALQGSTLLRKLNDGDYDGARNEFSRWNRGGGRVLEGLTRRRAQEAMLFGSGSADPFAHLTPGERTTCHKIVTWRLRAHEGTLEDQRDRRAYIRREKRKIRYWYIPRLYAAAALTGGWDAYYRRERIRVLRAVYHGEEL